MNSIFASISVILQDGGVYIGIFAALAVAMLIEQFYEHEGLSKLLGRCGAIALALLIGLRWETGTDWSPYLTIFYTNDTSADYDSAVFGIDMGYLWLNQFLYIVSRDYTVFLICCSFVTVAMVYWFIEKSTKFTCMGVYLFYTAYVVTHFIGSNRRMIAIGLVCVSFAFLRHERKLHSGFWRWLVPMAAALTIHRTSIAAVPGLIVSHKPWSLPWVVSGLVISLVLGIAGIPLAGLEALANLLSEYANITVVGKLVFYTSGDAELITNTSVGQQAIAGVLKRLSVLVIFISFIQKTQSGSYAHRLYNIYILGCIIYFLMIGGPIFQIVSTYYSIVEVALLPIIFYNLSKLKVLYILYLLIVPPLLLLSSLIPYLDLYVPYRSYFTTY